MLQPRAGLIFGVTGALLAVAFSACSDSTSPSPSDSGAGDGATTSDAGFDAPAESSTNDASINDASVNDANTDAPAEGSGDAAAHKRIFVTSGKWTGDLKTNGAGLNGLDGADKLCKSTATTAGLGGTWIAWLSDATTNAIDRINDVGPWYRIDGQKAFENKAALASNPAVALDINESGGTTTFLPWTGTNSGGAKNANNCTNWTAATGQGECGSSSATDATWTAMAALSCAIPYNLYCIEQ